MAVWWSAEPLENPVPAAAFLPRRPQLVCSVITPYAVGHGLFAQAVLDFEGALIVLGSDRHHLNRPPTALVVEVDLVTHI